jgi:hypothetical protein
MMDLFSQGVHVKGFLNEFNSLHEHPVMYDHMVGIPGHIEDFNVRAGLDDLCPIDHPVPWFDPASREEIRQNGRNRHVDPAFEGLKQKNGFESHSDTLNHPVRQQNPLASYHGMQQGNLDSRKIFFLSLSRPLHQPNSNRTLPFFQAI